MNHDNLNMPYAVYGTLREGHHNARLWTGYAESYGTDSVSGYRLVTNGGFPYALPAEGEVTVVEIIVPHRSTADSLRSRLDMLEGYPDFYDRLVVTTEDGVECMMYVPATPDAYNGLARVTDNDWNTHKSLRMEGAR
jgi:gamma-glutamylcyclotransferase (GGCT)/AIG2-like uncharacterized protein YtfP